MALKKYRYRNDIIISLGSIPIYLAAVHQYGLRVLLVLFFSILIGFLLEYSSYKLRKLPPAGYGFLTWILFPLFFPPVFPVWMCAAAVFFGSLVCVVFFGGYGKELISPIPVGIAFASLSYTSAFNFGWSKPFMEMGYGFSQFTASTLTIDHPVDYYLSKGPIPVINILWGQTPQPLANAIPVIVIGTGIILILLRAIDGKSVIIFGSTLFILNICFYFAFPDLANNPESVIIGNLLPAAFFIFGDNRFLARTHNGRIIIAVLTALLAFLIRNFAEAPEGIFFAIILGNVFSAIIDEAVLKSQFKGIAV